MCASWEGEGQDGYEIDDGLDWRSKGHRLLLSISMAADRIGSGWQREGRFSGRRQYVVAVTDYFHGFLAW
jgi:hypothetical protein